jgi:CBS domain-containing protein
VSERAAGSPARAGGVRTPGVRRRRGVPTFERRRARANAARRKEGNMRVEDVMSSAECCRETDTVRDCAKLMKEEEIGFLPICKESGEPIGAVTDRDLVIRVLAEGRSADEKLGPYMTGEIVSCRLEDDVQDALRLIREHKISRIMVCDDAGKLRGVVSLADIAGAESEESTGRTLQQVKSDQPTAH